MASLPSCTPNPLLSAPFERSSQHTGQSDSSLSPGSQMADHDSAPSSIPLPPPHTDIQQQSQRQQPASTTPTSAGPRSNITAHTNAFSTQPHQMKNNALFNTSQFFSKVPTTTKPITEVSEHDELDALPIDPLFDPVTTATTPNNASNSAPTSQPSHISGSSSFSTTLPTAQSTTTAQTPSTDSAFYPKPLSSAALQTIPIPQSWILHQLHLRQHQLSKIKIPLTIVSGSWNVNGKKPSTEPLDTWLFPLRSRVINPYLPTRTYNFTQPTSLDPRASSPHGASATAQFSSHTFNTPSQPAQSAQPIAHDDVPQLSSPASLVVVAFQEVVALSAKNLLVDPDGGLHWQNHISTLLNQTLADFYERIPAHLRPLHRDQYVLIAKDHLVGLSMLVWCRRSLVPLVSNVKIGRVGVGIMGVGGNKGAVGVSLFLGDTSLCFINAHIAAHQNKVEDRNAHYRSILQRFRFDTPVAPPISQLPSLPPTYDVTHSQYTDAAQGLPLTCPTGHGPPANTDIQAILAQAATPIKNSTSIFSSTPLRNGGQIGGTSASQSPHADALSMMMGDTSMIPTATASGHPSSRLDSKSNIAPPTPTLNNANSLSIHTQAQSSQSLHTSSLPATLTSPLTPTSRTTQTFQSNLPTIMQSPDVSVFDDDPMNTTAVLHDGYYPSPQIGSSPFLNNTAQSAEKVARPPDQPLPPPTPVVSSTTPAPPPPSIHTQPQFNANQAYTPHPTIPLHVVYQSAFNPHQQQQSTAPDLHVLDHSHIIWLGDLNYRLNHNQMDLIFQKIEQKDLTYLLSCDQLLAQKSFGRAFSEFAELPINFLPTYKYIPGQHLYERRPGKKIRMPSYCDRIQYRSSTTNQLKGVEYDRAELLISDHKPVRLTSTVDAHIFDRQKYQQLYQSLKSLHNASLVKPSISLTWGRIFFPQVRNNIVQTSSIQLTNTSNIVIRYECIITQIDPSSLQFFPTFLKTQSDKDSDPIEKSSDKGAVRFNHQPSHLSTFQKRTNNFASHMTLFDDCKLLSRQQLTTPLGLTSSSAEDVSNFSQIHTGPKHSMFGPTPVPLFIPAEDPSRLSTSFPDGMIPAPPKVLDFKHLSTQFNAKPIIDTTPLESREGRLGKKHPVDGLASLWLSITPDKGILAPGEEVNIDIKVHVQGKEGQRCQIGQLPLSSMVVVRVIDACVRQWGLEIGPTCVEADDKLWVQTRNTTTLTLTSPTSIAPTLPSHIDKSVVKPTESEIYDDSSDDELAAIVDKEVDQVNNERSVEKSPASSLAKFTNLFKVSKTRPVPNQTPDEAPSLSTIPTPTSALISEKSELTSTSFPDRHDSDDDDVAYASTPTPGSLLGQTLSFFTNPSSFQTNSNSLLNQNSNSTPFSSPDSTNPLSSSPPIPTTTTTTTTNQASTTSQTPSQNTSTNRPTSFFLTPAPQYQAPTPQPGQTANTNQQNHNPAIQPLDSETLFWQYQSTPVEYAFFVGGTYIHSVIGTKLATLIGPDPPSQADDPILLEKYRYSLEQPFREPYSTSSQKVLMRTVPNPAHNFTSHFGAPAAAQLSHAGTCTPPQPGFNQPTSSSNAAVGLTHAAAPTTTLTSVLQPIQALKHRQSDHRFHPNSIPKEIRALFGAILRHPGGSPFEQDLFQPISGTQGQPIHQNQPIQEGYWTSHPSLHPCLLRHIIVVRDVLDTAPNGLLHAVSLYQIPLPVLGHFLVDLLQQLPEPLLPPPSHRVIDFSNPPTTPTNPNTTTATNAPQYSAPLIKRDVSHISSPDITSVSSASQLPETITPPPGTTTTTPQIAQSPLQQLTKWILGEIPPLHYPILITLLSFFRSLIRSNRISCQQLTLILAKPLTHIVNIHQPLQFCANKSASHLIYHIFKEA